MTPPLTVRPELVEGPSFFVSDLGEKEQGSDTLTPNGEEGVARLDSAIRAALAKVHDPCSVAAGRPKSLLDMRLVLGWTLKGSTLDVTFCVTFPGCTMAPHFTEAARAELLRIDGVDAVRLRVDTEHIWQGIPAVEMRGTPQAWRGRSADART